MAKSKNNILDKHKVIIISAIALALLTPFMVRFMTTNTTSTVNYAAENQITSSINLISSNITPRIGEYVSFETTYPKNVKNPRIEVLCYQNGEKTYGMAGAVDYQFLLGGSGSIWYYDYPNEGAECVANLFYFGKDKGMQTYIKLASTSFQALGKSQ